MSDEDLQRTPYTDLWLAEMGAAVPQWDGINARPYTARDVRPAHARRGRHASAPDPTRADTRG